MLTRILEVAIFGGLSGPAVLRRIGGLLCSEDPERLPC